MQINDLQVEVREQERLISKLSLGVKLNKEKDTAKYTSEKKQLARMRTILTEKETEELLAESSESTVATSERPGRSEATVSVEDKSEKAASPSKKS